MGCLFTKPSGHHSPPSPPRSSSSSSKPMLSRHLNSYREACDLDPDLKSFDSIQEYRTIQVIKSFAEDIPLRSLSLNSVSQAIGNLQDMNGDAVKFILECGSDISKSHKLSSLVKDFFRLSILTVDFCITLENCLKNARDSSSFLKIAIDQFDKDKDHLKTLEHFKAFKALESPFTKEFFEKFQSVQKQQQSMQRKLEKQMSKVGKKLKSSKIWKRLTNMIFIVTFSTLVICSVIAATVAAPPVVLALAAVVPAGVGSTWTWVELLWKEYRTELKGQKELIGKLPFYNNVVIKDLENIMVLVNKFGNEKKDLVKKAEFAIKEDEKVVVATAVATAVDEMKKIMNNFEKTIDDLSEGSKKIRGDLDIAENKIVNRLASRWMF